VFTVSQNPPGNSGRPCKRRLTKFEENQIVASARSDSSGLREKLPDRQEESPYIRGAHCSATGAYQHHENNGDCIFSKKQGGYSATAKALRMARANSEERENQRSIEVGRQNALLNLRLQGWCSHLSVNLVNFGLLAEMTKLPIGRMDITCPHATEGISAHDLKSVASYFVLNNCRGCQHQQELNTDNAGRDILREADNIEKQQALAAPQQGSATARVHSVVSGRLEEALKSAPVTEQSVLQLLALLGDENHATEASESLRQSAELAPDLFSDLASAALAEYLPNLMVGANCAETLRILGRKRGQLPPSAVLSALRCIETGHCHEAVVGLYADALNAGYDTPPMAVVAKIIGLRSADDDFPFARREATYPGQEAALLAVGKKRLDLLEEVFKRRFENPDHLIRVGASKTLRAILPSFPDLGPALTAGIIDSLSLDDENYGPSADVEATRVLADIFVWDPEGTRAKIDAAFPASSEEIKGLLFRVYRSVVEKLGGGWQEPVHKDSDRCVPHVFDALLPALTSTSVPLEARGDVARIVERLADRFPEAAGDRVNSILGALALVTREEADFFEIHKGGDPHLPGFPRMERSQYNIICNGLVKTLEDLAENAPASTWTALSQVMESLPSSDKPNSMLKARLLELYVPLSKNHSVAPRLIPSLFRALMEMEVPLLRCSALKVIQELLSRSPELVPDNMREIVLIYLKDSFVYVHQGAAKAVQHLPMRSAHEAFQVAEILSRHFITYTFKGENDWRYGGEVLDALAKVCSADEALPPTYLLPLAIAQCRKADTEHEAMEGLKHLRCLTKGDGKYSAIYVREVMEFFTRFPQSCHQFERFSNQHEYFRSLFDLPSRAIGKNTEGFRKAIPEITKYSIPAAFSFLAVLLYHEHYQLASELGALIPPNVAPRVNPRYITEEAQIFSVVANTEAKLKAGKIGEAKQDLKNIESIVDSHDKTTQRDDFQAVSSALSLADKVAGRLD
jgi:hypothetical protein